MKNSSYTNYPIIKVQSTNRALAWRNWNAICSHVSDLLQNRHQPSRGNVIVIECYQGVNPNEVVSHFLQALPGLLVIEANRAYKDEAQIQSMVYPDVTDDRVFGFITRLNLEDYIDSTKQVQLKRDIAEHLSATDATILVIGAGALIVWETPDVFIYADMPRWEIQQRQRRHECDNLGLSNRGMGPELLYKQSYFVDWRVLDRWKRRILRDTDYILDTSRPGDPSMVDGASFFSALEQVVSKPFELVPFFDPGVWGGQWMKAHCNLEKEVPNFAWCFNCVPEENSVALQFGDVLVEVPAQSLVIFESRKLLGDPVYARFGEEFPIRFDFLDTMQGQNLSFQVHPLTQYIREQFGMHYTQDESYYLLETGENSLVYLGLTDEATQEEMRAAIEGALHGDAPFDVQRFVASWQVHKHDHVLIPAGTPHCSGANCVVLEISATPYIFTFKLWDWERLGMDGRPRPINLKHGFKNIQWDRRTDWVRNNLINRIETVAQGAGWREERTGLHALEFIESRRHWFTTTVQHDTGGQAVGSVNVICLVEGEQIIVESPTNAFEPLIVNYAETFVVPAAIGQYAIRPYGPATGKQCATMKAFVRR